MVKRKKKKMGAGERFLKRTFGNKFNLWDLGVVLIIFGYPVYIVLAFGWEILASDVAGYIWGAFVGGFLVSLFRRKARK